jgi:hypothetical protein
MHRKIAVCEIIEQERKSAIIRICEGMGRRREKHYEKFNYKHFSLHNLITYIV